MTFKPLDYAATAIAAIPVIEKCYDAGDRVRLAEVLARLREAQAGRVPCSTVLDRILDIGNELQDEALKAKAAKP